MEENFNEPEEYIKITKIDWSRIPYISDLCYQETHPKGVIRRLSIWLLESLSNGWYGCGYRYALEHIRTSLNLPLKGDFKYCRLYFRTIGTIGDVIECGIMSFDNNADWQLVLTLIGKTAGSHDSAYYKGYRTFEMYDVSIVINCTDRIIYYLSCNDGKVYNQVPLSIQPIEDIYTHIDYNLFHYLYHRYCYRNGI